MRFDVFCHTIDNWGDVGVAWRLSRQLAARGHRVRLALDETSALEWMAPERHWHYPQIAVQDWEETSARAADDIPDVVIELFGCTLPQSYQAALAQHTARQQRQPLWINLEYLSAETFAGRAHLLPSPVLHGAAAGLHKTFFYPGFTPHTGGLLREPGLQARQRAFDRTRWLAQHNVAWSGERIISLFCYEPQALGLLLQRLHREATPTLLLVTAGRAAQATLGAMGALHPIEESTLRVVYLPLLSQDGYDALLWASELNFVRGEDSLVRAIHSGKPFVWQIYPQSDNAHHAKLQAFLNHYTAQWEDAVAQAFKAMHLLWNSLPGASAQALEAIVQEGRYTAWRTTSEAQGARYADERDLVTQLLALCVPWRSGG